MDTGQLRKIVHHMKKSKSIDVYASAGHIYFAENFKFHAERMQDSYDDF